ncbi:kinase-like domain-containing protein [Mucor mucedo]|uniref:kinase-like domain-containing protein n=2 Tax=Mucor mucedo TaxID=29922 RepID=UPI00221F07F7|nr:kinase-like domain-containing protein [Mucor mucedo]KAI7868649.1 kinase-like domain-containing protein [Mucor mucedo]
MSSSNPFKRPFDKLGSYITRTSLLLQEIEQDELDHFNNDAELDISCREYLPSFVKDRTERENIPTHVKTATPSPSSPKRAKTSTQEEDANVKSLPSPLVKKEASVKHFDSFPRYHSVVNNKGPVEPRCLEEITVNGKKYLVLKPLGEGGSGKVFQVFSYEHTENFALKWVKVRNKEEMENVKNEIELMRLLEDSVHTITLFDSEFTPQVVLMIMEYGEMDFATLIKIKSLSPWDIDFIRYYWKQMLQAVCATHGKDIIHSDLKPANFIVIRGSLKLIDFGIAAVVPDYTTHIARDYQVGTRNFMAPETFTEGSNSASDTVFKQGRPSDIWSLGCILYQMIFGLPPFYSVPKHMLAKTITNPNHDIAFPKHAKYAGETIDIPEELSAVLKMCLHRNPKLRPTMSELLNTKF